MSATPPISPTSPFPPSSDHQPTLNGSQPHPPENIFRAVQSYTPRHEGEIALHLSDIVTNTKDLGNGWTLGQNVSRDGLGIFPSNSIQPLSIANTVNDPPQGQSATTSDDFRNFNNQPRDQSTHSDDFRYFPADNEQGLNPEDNGAVTRRLGRDTIKGENPVRSVKYNPELQSFSSSAEQRGNCERAGGAPHTPANRQYLQVARQAGDGKVTSSLLPTDRDTGQCSQTEPSGRDLSYEVLRPRISQDSPSHYRSSPMSSRDVDFNFTKQKESPRLSSFKPPGGRIQNYSRDNSVDSDYGVNEISHTIGGDQLGPNTSANSQETPSDISNHGYPLPVGGKIKGEDLHTKTKGKNARRASPKRVRLLVGGERRVNETQELGPESPPNKDTSVSTHDSSYRENSNPSRQLPNVISEPIGRSEESIGLSPECNQRSDSSGYRSQGLQNTEIRGESLSEQPVKQEAAQLPVKRGRVTPPQIKPQLAVKPNHISMDESDLSSRGQSEETLPQQRVRGDPPPQSPRVQSSPRSRMKASPRSLRRPPTGQMNPTNPNRGLRSDLPGSSTLPPNMSKPISLHDATSVKNPTHFTNGSGFNEMEQKINDLENVRRIIPHCEEICGRSLPHQSGKHANPGAAAARSVIVTAMPQCAQSQDTPHYPAASANVCQLQDCGQSLPDTPHYPAASANTCQHQECGCITTSPIYVSHDTLHSCGSIPQCNSLMYDTDSQRDNYTNETLTRESSLPPISSSQEREFYGDYRSLDGSCTPQNMDKSVRFRNQNTKYKPILKHQRVGDSKGQQIYYQAEQGKDPVIRLIFAIITGLVIGFILFSWMYFCLGYALIVALSVSITIATLAIIALSLSRLIRCMTALALPSLCTTRGRIAFLILITGLLFGGPVKNVYFNMHEVSRSMSCSAEQAFNQSMLLLKPFDTMMQQLESTVEKLEIAAWEVDKGLKPLDAGLQKVDRNLQKGRVFLTYTSEACTGMIQTAFTQCKQGIEAAQTKCLGVITDLGTVFNQAQDVLDRINPERWAPKQQHLFKRQIIVGGTNAPAVESEIPEEDSDICEALDMNQVCESLNQTEMLCKPSMWAGDAIQEAINSTQKAMFRLRKQLQFNVKSDPFSMARVNASKVVFHIRQAVLEQFESRTLYFERVISILIKIVPVAVILLFYVSYIHIKYYMSKDNYDNNYITKTFWALDQKRAEIAGSHLFPLKPYERHHLVDTTVSDLSPPEEGLFRMGLCVFFMHLLLSFTCYMFDFILYWILSLIREHGNPPSDVTGQAALENVLEGEGAIVELLDIFLIGFHRGNSYAFDRGENQCLPYPHTPSLVYVIVMAVLYLILLLTILFKAYLIRLRHHITGFFYPERRKQRTVHLYNIILNQRTRLPRILQARARNNNRERRQQEEISFCHKVAAKCVPCRVFLYRSPRCLVCGQKEDHTFRDCETEKCTGVYCAQCYSDLGRVCPLCLHGNDYEEDEENANYEEMEDDLQQCQRSSKIYL